MAVNQETIAEREKQLSLANLMEDPGAYRDAITTLPIEVSIYGDTSNQKTKDALIRLRSLSEIFAGMESVK